jgi:hypothetical protein
MLYGGIGNKALRMFESYGVFVFVGAKVQSGKPQLPGRQGSSKRRQQKMPVQNINTSMNIIIKQNFVF